MTLRILISITLLLLNFNKIYAQIDNLAPIDTVNAVKGDWVIVGNFEETENLNPITSITASSDEIDSYLYESLTNIDPLTHELIPEVASLPEISTDYSIFTYHINKNAQFSDGTSLTGEDVIFTLKSIKNPFVNGYLANYYEFVESAELVGPDKNTVKIILNNSSWRSIYKLGFFWICEKKNIDPHGITDKISWNDLKDINAATKNDNVLKMADFLNSNAGSINIKYLIGSGPYMLEKISSDSIILIRNSNYKGKLPSYPDKLIFKWIQNNSVAVVDAMNQEIDVTYVNSPADFFKTLENSEKHNLVKGQPSEPSYTYLAWNENNLLFNDKDVRMALSYLIDRESISNEVLYGGCIFIQSPVFYRDSKMLNKDLNPIEYNPEKAKSLLKNAGWEDTDGDGILDKTVNGKKIDFKFTFLINDNPNRKRIVQEVIKELKQANIQADIQIDVWSNYLDKTKQHQFDATYGAWTIPNTPYDPYPIWHSSQAEGEGSNYISFKNEESDKLIEQYNNEIDEGKRIEILKKWQYLIYEQQPYTFLWSGFGRYVYNNRFRNVRWYNENPSPKYNEWWVPKEKQKYK